MRPRTLFLSNVPVPHQLDLLAAVHDAGELDLRAIFLAEHEPERTLPSSAELRARSLPGVRVLPALRGPLPPELHLHPTLLPELVRAQPDVAIVGGYSYATLQAALVALAALRVPTLLWAERPRAGQGSLAVRALRTALLQTVRLARGVLAVGSRAAQIWRSVLGPSMPIASFPYVCDIDRFLALPRAPRETFTWLFVGRLVALKGVDVLLDAFAIAAAREPRLRLLIAGDGPERERLQQRAPASLAERIEWLGLVPWEKLPAVYARADALAIPSRQDGWAMVVNEAFAAGLPVVASVAVGAAIDLVREGETGRVVPAGDAAALGAALLEVPRDAPALGARARQIAREELSPARAAARLAIHVRRTMAGEPIA